MRREKQWKHGFNAWKKGLKKKVAYVSLASIVLHLTSCHRQAAVITERIYTVPEIRIDTTYRWKSDTVFRIETDSILIETLIHDTLIWQHVRTKPQYIKVRDTVTIEASRTKTAKAAEKKNAKERNVMFFIFCAFVGLVIYWLAKNKKSYENKKQ